MNDMRHLYGMPKSAAARQDEFKQNLRGFFQMKKQAAYDSKMLKDIKSTLAQLPLGGEKAAGAAVTGAAPMNPADPAPANNAPVKNKRLTSMLAGARLLNPAPAATLTPLLLEKYRSRIKEYKPGVATGLTRFTKNPGIKAVLDKYTAPKPPVQEQPVQEQPVPATGLNKTESATGEKYDYSQIFNKKASVKHWDIVHAMLKSAAKAASECKLCGKPSKECKCDKTAKCASGTSQVCKSAKLPR